MNNEEYKEEIARLGADNDILARRIQELEQTVANLVLDVGRLQKVTAPIEHEQEMTRLANEAYRANGRGDC